MNTRWDMFVRAVLKESPGVAVTRSMATGGMTFTITADESWTREGLLAACPCRTSYEDGYDENWRAGYDADEHDRLLDEDEDAGARSTL